MEVFVDIVLNLFIYSFLGWCCETLYCSLGTGKFVNRGFLNGPFCPVYGFGALIVLTLLSSFPNKVIVVFAAGMLVTSMLEYFTSWLMEKLFHAKWWDYSAHRFNIAGRVCLLNSTMFGILCVVVKIDINPPISQALLGMSLDFKLGLTVAILVYFAADLAVTVYTVLGLNKRVSIIGKIRAELIEAYQTINEHLETSEIIQILQDKEVREERVKELKDKLGERNILHKRLLDAFPEYSAVKGNEIVSAIKKIQFRNKK